MGCDIHPYPEKLVDGEWVTAEPFVLSKWWDERILGENFKYETPEYDRAEAEHKAMTEDEIWEKYGNDINLILDGPWDNNYDLRGRNYTWFAILAGIRNGLGIEPMDAARGLPIDVSPEIKRESDSIDTDGHTHSWFTLQELMDYDWDGLVLHDEGLVGKDGFMQYKTDGYPNYWRSAEWVDENNELCITNNQMGQICLGIYGLLEPNRKYYTKIAWDQSHRDAVGWQYLKGIFDKLASYGEPDEVRLVFWFDN